MPSTLYPYCGPAPTLQNALSSWNFDPVLIACIAGVAVALQYAAPHPRGWKTSVLVFLLIAAFVSPLCSMTSALFSARLAHHILIGSVIAPFVVMIGWPTQRWLATIPLEAVFVAHTTIYWVWHLPFGYAFALSGTWQYWLMQIAFIVASILLWHALLSRSTSVVATTSLALGTMVQMGFLGAILTFAPVTLFEAHFTTTQAFGLTPLEDQQLAGVLMWTLGFTPYAIVVLWCMRTRLLHSRPAEQ
ncbi:cytochrome c oxidase assembly protein [Agrobacterium rubi]|uniref:cytochrome c oxidase assembly protein n=1 Tax=Agrobacterium rubi TaxID=28099 RepID=UPI00201B79B0|nr:cytochrome c oxidase assembly protein [Agrobacterium rubi]